MQTNKQIFLVCSVRVWNANTVMSFFFVLCRLHVIICNPFAIVLGHFPVICGLEVNILRTNFVV